MYTVNVMQNIYEITFVYMHTFNLIIAYYRGKTTWWSIKNKCLYSCWGLWRKLYIGPCIVCVWVALIYSQVSAYHFQSQSVAVLCRVVYLISVFNTLSKTCIDFHLIWDVYMWKIFENWICVQGHYHKGTAWWNVICFFFFSHLLSLSIVYRIL